MSINKDSNWGINEISFKSKIIGNSFCFSILLNQWDLFCFWATDNAKNGMVVSANSLASEVGIQILKEGGNAIDAAVAVGFALAVTYPYAGNLGWGGFMVIHLNDGKNTSIDFREKAPLSVHKDIYLDDYGNYVSDLSQTGATSVGVPGSVAGLIYALEKYGTLSLEKVIQPAIDLAENGWELDTYSSKSFANTLEKFREYPSSYNIFANNGEV